MKNIFLLFILLLSFTLISQPVITNNVHAPKIGQSFNLVSYQAEGEEEYFEVQPGTAGINKEWNFENLKKGIETGNSFVDLNVLKLKDVVKNLDVNILNKSNDGETNLFTLLKVSETELISRGITDDTFIVQAVPSPILMKFPFRYGDKFETKSGLRFGDSTEFISTRSSIQTEADAYGSLRTADGKYDQVLRVRSYSVDSVNISFGEGFQFSFVDTTVNYQWFAADKPGIIFQLNTLFVEGKQVGDGYSYIKSDVTNTQKFLAETTSIFPNPFTDIIKIQTEENINEYRLNVFDYSGKLVSDHQLDNSKASGIDLSFLSEGVYFLRIYSGSKVLKTIKLVKKS